MPVTPRVTVVVPTYQRVDTVERAVRSVLAQQGPPFEVVVVDDGSTDGTAERLAAVDDPRLRVLRQPNAGRGAARNAGARIAAAPILTFLDSDDEALPGWLAEIDRRLDPGSVPVLRMPVLVARPGSSLHRRPAGPLDPRRPFPRGARQPGSWAVATAVFQEVGGFDPGLEFSENTDLLVRLALASGRRGWSAATSDEAGVLLHAEGSDARVGRYGSAPGDAAETLLARYASALRHDRSTRHDYRAIVGVHALRAGRRRDAARSLMGSWVDRPWSPIAATRLLSVVLPPRVRVRLSAARPARPLRRGRPWPGPPARS